MPAGLVAVEATVHEWMLRALKAGGPLGPPTRAPRIARIEMKLDGPLRAVFRMLDPNVPDLMIAGAVVAEEKDRTSERVAAWQVIWSR